MISLSTFISNETTLLQYLVVKLTPDCSGRICMQNNLSFFFEPKSVAVIGASANPGKLSYGILKNLSQYGYQGKIFPINPKSAEIMGYPCYASINDVPADVDLAVIILPAEMILDMLRDCGAKGVKACIIISGGFKELGEEGQAREEQVKIAAREMGIRIIGPNCVGNVNIASGLNTTFIKGMPAKGGIAFVSQSGAVCGGVVDHILDEGIGFSHLISLGNEMDVTETDMLEYLANDPQTKVIAAYVESIRDGERFMQVASRVTRQKPIVLLKAGKSESGAKAVSSHTGSLAGSQTAYTTAFHQAEVIEVNSLRSLLQVAMAFDFQSLPENNQAVIFTNAGGPAALLSDSLDAHGFKLADLTEEVQQQLKTGLNPAAQTMNPIDMLGGASEEEYAFALRVAIEKSDAGTLLPVLVPQALVDPVAVAEAFIHETRQSHRTVIACMVGQHSIHEAKLLLHQNHIPVVDYPEDIGEILGAMLAYRLYKEQPGGRKETRSRVDKKKALGYFNRLDNKKFLGEAETRPLLDLYGIDTVAGMHTRDLSETRVAAEKLGYPIALKIVSNDILHKSDAGGIRLDIRDQAHLDNAYRSMLAEVKDKRPKAKLEGVLVEKMYVAGAEVIIGMKRDTNFGAMLMFGMGGIYVEAFHDISFRIAPLDDDEIQQMIRETVAGKILMGLRGTMYDVNAVANVIQAIGQMAIDFPHIQEIEINPLKVLPEGSGVVALDARMILS